MTGEADFLRVGFLGGIDVLVSVPKPLMLERGIERAKRIGQIAFIENGFAKPSTQNAIQNDASHLRLLNTDRLEISLMIEPTRRVVVSIAVPRSDVERHVHATSDFVEHFLLELGVSRSRLLPVRSLKFHEGNPSGNR